MAAGGWTQRLGSITLKRTLMGGALLASVWAVDAALSGPPTGIGRGDGTALDMGAAADPADSSGVDAQSIRLAYIDAAWTRVLDDLSSRSGLGLVMDRAPGGRFTRRDRAKYSLAEALRVINAELEPQGFRVLQKGEFLVVLELTATRAEFSRPPAPVPVAPGQRSITEAAVDAPAVPKRQRDFRSITPSGATSESGVRRFSTGSDGSYVRHASSDEPQPEVVETVRTRHRSARDVAMTLYTAFKDRAELIDDGPNGLPAFRVYRPASSIGGTEAASAPREIEFTVGIDMQREELVIAAAAPQARGLAQLVQRLDVPAEPGAPQVRLITTQNDVQQLARTLQPELRRMVAQVDPAQPLDGNQPQLPQPGEGIDPQTGEPVEPSIVDGLRGDVSVEALQYPGVLILRGNEADVESVMRVIREIERLSEGTMPDVHLLFLRNVNSEALAELLTEVYEQLSELRARGGTETQSVAILPVVKPNALLILAPGTEMQSIIDLAEELDQPVDPLSEVEVFWLKSAPATQVLTMLEEFYAERPGLGTRVTAVADSRTNSVIVQARPADLAEVAALIRKIDRDESAAVNHVRIVPLRNAIASELAQIINTAIQGVLNRPTTGGAGGQFAQQQQGGQQNQALLEPKSVVLEFLTSAPAAALVRSGILADIRVTADVRTNSLMLTAPEQSMDLMLALIAGLDQPPNSVAEIKVFTLANSDATATVALLETLFAPQDNTDTALGIQIAGADDAGSSLIPLRFEADVRTNSVIAIGGAEAMTVVEALLLRLDESDVRERQWAVIKLKNSFVNDVATAINQYLTQLRTLSTLDPNLVSNVELLEREIVVVPEPITNNLLVSATPKYFEDIRDLILKLDEQPPQVVIQALMVEVELQNTDEFGVELGIQDPLLFARSSAANVPGFNFNNNPLGNTPVDPSNVGTQSLSNLGVGRTNSDLGFGGFVFAASSESVSVLIRALAARRNIHVLSRPQIRTLDNILAQIQVGQEVPVVSGVTISQGLVSPNVEREPAGIILRVRPRISPDGTIVIETYAEKSAFSGGVPIFVDTDGNVIESPIKDITAAEAVVSVPNGQTIVMGGMITKSEDTVERKVPWLGDIPILGIPFRFDSTTSRRTELLIFLTPRIVLSDFDNEMIKRIEAERMHFIESEAEAIHGPLFAVPLEAATGPVLLPDGSVLPEHLYENENCPTTIIPEGGMLPAPAEELQPLPSPLQPMSAQGAGGTGVRSATHTSAEPQAKPKRNWFGRDK